MADAPDKITHSIMVFAENFQFQLQDQIEDCDYPEDWNDSLLSQLYVGGRGIVGIGTVRDLDIELTLEVYAAPMDEKDMNEDPEVGEFDHVVQCNIEVPSGKLLVTGSTTEYDDTYKLEIPAGQYGMRIFWSGLDTLDELGFEGDDKYLIQLYPETPFEERIIKTWRQLALQLNPQNN
ncbi:MAG: hypothetical protein K2X27_22000 [Candidatus Obscuribacterales bacterium]|nr:hypothetical protein [Candidatus Obscuribacterales bacterium]